jgi:hypothetical protein
MSAADKNSRSPTKWRNRKDTYSVVEAVGGTEDALEVRGLREGLVAIGAAQLDGHATVPVAVEAGGQVRRHGDGRLARLGLGHGRHQVAIVVAARQHEEDLLERGVRDAVAGDVQGRLV